jgi:nucleotide-binding universal stress UspA family protein
VSHHIVVGYTHTKSGKDAVALGARLAAASGAILDLVMVLPTDSGTLVPPDAAFERHLREQAMKWLETAATRVPAGVQHAEHVGIGESYAEGLNTAADELGASLIVVGAANGGPRGHHRIGSTAAALLHSADVPVALAPAGERKADATTGIPRITVAVGTRAGAEGVIESAVAGASLVDAPVRMVSLVTVDLPSSVDTGVIRVAGAAHAEDVLAKARRALPEAIHAEVLVGRGESVEDAVRELDWLPGEVVLVGSSRLAQPKRIFLGSTATKMLHELPVPMIVIPRRTGGDA